VPSPKHGRDYHKLCPHKTKAACEQAQRAELGRCSAMTQSETECSNWAVDRVNDRPYCGQHIASIAAAADKERRQAIRKARMDQAADEFIEFTKLHPSVWG